MLLVFYSYIEYYKALKHAFNTRLEQCKFPVFSEGRPLILPESY